MTSTLLGDQVRLLLQHSADPLKEERQQGVTPLHIAADKGQVEVETVEEVNETNSLVTRSCAGDRCTAGSQSAGEPDGVVWRDDSTPSRLFNRTAGGC